MKEVRLYLGMGKEKKINNIAKDAYMYVSFFCWIMTLNIFLVGQAILLIYIENSHKFTNGG